MQEPSCETDTPHGNSTPDAAESEPPSSGRTAKSRQLGRYVVLHELGAGGMGVVYAAHDPELDRAVAIKVLHRRDHDAASRARLRREAQAMAKLQHPNVVAVYDVGAADGDTFVAMELVRGGSLRQWLERPRAWREVVDVFVAAGRGLAAAHALGLVHRDFKPDNVLRGHDGVARVTDFGLVRGLGASEGDRRVTWDATSDPALTKRGAVVGTPAYMAPEQIEGTGLDARTDQFSFCVALWEGLYGSRPFVADNVVALAAAIARGQLQAPPRGSVPRWLHRMVLRGLATDPDARWPSMEALLDALSRGRHAPRRTAMLAVAGVASIAVASAWLLAPTEAEHSCGATGEELASIWNADVAARLTAKFVGTSVPSAADTAAKVRDSLDAWAAKWTHSRRDLCDATRVGDGTADALVDRRAACLQRRRGELDATLSVLARADAQVVVRALDAVHALGAVEACDAAEVSSSAIEPPPAESRERVEATERTVAEAKALDETGRYAEGLELARRAVADARELGYLPLLARALYILGRVETDSALVLTYEETLVEAVHTAELAGEDALAAEVQVRLLYEIGVGKGHLDRGRKRLPFAEAAVRRAGNDPSTLAAFHNARAGMLYWEQRYDEARSAYEQVLRLRQQAFGDEAPEALRTLHNIALVQAEQGQRVEALANHRIALAADEQVLGADHPRLSYSLAYIGGLQEALGDHDGALVTYQRQLRIREHAFGLDNVKTINVHRGIVSALIALGRLDEAEAEARIVAEAHHRSGNVKLHEAAAAGHALLAQIAGLRGRADEVVSLRREALRLYELDYRVEHPGLATPLVELAEAELVVGRNVDAALHAQRALDLEDRVDRPGDPGLWQRARDVLARARQPG